MSGLQNGLQNGLPKSPPAARSIRSAAVQSDLETLEGTVTMKPTPAHALTLTHS